MKVNIIGFLKENWIFFVILLFFGVLYTTTLTSYGMFMWDEAEYAALGRSIQTGQGYTESGQQHQLRPPVFPLLIATSFLISGSTNDLTAKVPVFLLALGSISLIYLFMSRLVDRNTGLISAFLLGISPLFWEYTANLLSEMCFLFFYLGAIAFFYLGTKNSKIFYLSWLFFGLALLTRYTALLFLPTIAIYIVLLLFFERKEAVSLIKQKHFLISPVIAGLILLPWLLRQYLTFGDPFVGFRIASTQLVWDAVSMPFYEYLVYMPQIVSIITFVFFLIGLVYVLLKRNKIGIISIITILVSLVYFSQFGFKEPRQIFVLIPFIVLVSALGFMKVVYPIIKKNINGKVAVSAILIILALAFFFNYGEANMTLSGVVANGYPTLIDAGNFLKEHASKGDNIIAASVPQMYWYSGFNAFSYPENQSNLADVISTKNIKYVVVNNYERQQPIYVINILQKFTESDLNRTDVGIFYNEQFKFVTIVMPSQVFLEKALEEPNQTTLMLNNTTY